MIIKDFHIVHFGKLSDFSLAPGEQIQILEGNNNSGKSTVAAFILFMLYGLDKSDPLSCEKSINNETNTAEGTMTIQVKEGEYVLTRKAERIMADGSPVYRETSKIFYPMTEKETVGENAGDRWLSLSRSTYSRLAHMGQENDPQNNEANTKYYLENLLFSGDEKLNLQNAVECLKKERDRLITSGEKIGEIDRLVATCAELRGRHDTSVEQYHQYLAAQARYEKIDKEYRATVREYEKFVRLDKLYSDLQTLDTFDHLYAMNRKIQEIDCSLGILRQKLTRGAFFADRQYLTELTVERDEWVDASKAYQFALDELERDKGDDNVSDTLKNNFVLLLENGGLSRVREEAKRLRSRSRVAHILSVAVTFLLFVCLGAGVFFFPFLREADTLTKILAASGCALLTAATVWAWLFFFKRLKPEKKYYFTFSASSRKAMEKRITEAERAQETESARIAKINAAEQYLTSARASLASARNRLEASIARFTQHPVSDEKQLLPATDMLIRQIENCLLDIAALEEERKKCVAFVERYKKTLEGYSEERLRKSVVAIDRLSLQDLTPDLIAQELSEQSRKINLLKESRDAQAAELKRLEENLPDPIKDAEHLSQAEALRTEREKRLKALDFALSQLLDSNDNIRSHIPENFPDIMTELMKFMTGDASVAVDISKNLTITITQHGNNYPLDCVSGALRESAYTALKLSLIITMSKNELPPLLLDEAFAHLDDGYATGMMNMIRYLAEKLKMQTILLTCRGREAVLAREIFENRDLVGCANMSDCFGNPMGNRIRQFISFKKPL